MIRLLLSVLFVGITLPALAQPANARFEWLINKDGLPSNTVNVAAEDGRGFMWFGTRKYLTRYDGNAFQNVNLEGITGLAVDRAGAVYASTQTAGALVRVSSVGQPPETRCPTLTDNGGAYNTFVDSFGHVWYSDRKGIWQYDPATQKRRFYPMKQTTVVFHKGSFAEDNAHNLWVMGFEVGLFRYDRRADKLRCVFGLDCPRPSATMPETPLRGGFFDKKGLLWIANERGGILRFDPRTNQLKRFPLPTGQAFTLCPDTDAQGRAIIWTGGEGGIFLFRPDSETFQSFPDLLPGPFIVLSSYRAKTGIVWFCTTEGLLRYNPHNQAIQTNQITGLVKPQKSTVNAFLTDHTDPTGQTVWLAVAYNGLLRWNRKDNSTRLFRFPAHSAALEAAWLVQDKQNRIWVGGNQWEPGPDGKSDRSDNRFEGIFGFDPRTETYLKTPFTVHHGFFSVPFYSLGMTDRRGRFWVVNHYEGVHVLDPATNRELTLWDKPAHDSLMHNGNWVMCLLEDSRGRVWLGTGQGLYFFDETNRKFVLTQPRFALDSWVLGLAEDHAGNLWATGWHMLAKLSLQGKVLKQWSEKDGLYDAECRRIAVDAQNQVWVGSYDGLHVLDEARNTIRRFTVNDGLLANTTTNGLTASASGTELLVGGMGGWNIINTRTASRETVANNLQISSIRVNNQESPRDWQRAPALDYTENALAFDVSAMNFLPPAYNAYAWFLDGFDKAWTPASPAHLASYTNLPPGHYTFRVRATNEFDRQRVSTLAVPFVIAPAFYQTWWFKLAAILLTLGLLGLFYRSRLSYQTIKARLALEEENLQKEQTKHHDEVAAYQLKLSETEMAALRAQMNPHFIFNCLNSIQYFTLKNDTEQASDYLTKFSRLIRLVLENSRSERVTLRNELETLQLYMDMEAMRFKQKVRHSITVADSIDAEMLQIPPLLLQPFVENAIWHGLMHKDEGGTVSVDVAQPRPDCLRISIRDDGVGRAKAAEYKSKSATKNKSFGLKLTADRIDLINQLYHTHTAVEVHDLTDARGEPAGTLVVIEIPV